MDSNEDQASPHREDSVMADAEDGQDQPEPRSLETVGGVEDQEPKRPEASLPQTTAVRAPDENITSRNTIKVSEDGTIRLMVLIRRNFMFQFVVNESILPHLPEFWSKQKPGGTFYVLDVAVETCSLAENPPMGLLKSVVRTTHKLLRIIDQLSNKSKQKSSEKHNAEDNNEDEVVIGTLELRELFLLAHYQPILTPSPLLDAHFQSCLQSLVKDMLSNEKIALDMPKGAWEMALHTCIVFSWPEYYKAIRGRIGYLCQPSVNSHGNKTLRHPLSRYFLDATTCGQETIDAIVDARASVLPRLIRSVARWYEQLTQNTYEWPCSNEQCNVSHRESLRQYMILTQLFIVKRDGQLDLKGRRGRINQSLWEIAMLGTPVFVDGEGQASYKDELNRWKGTCSQCWGVDGTTEFLSSVSSLVSEVSSWEIQARMRETIPFPGEEEKKWM
ncbi:hypothetical protein OQA88_7837 [Cercophora sp. LCS_1]